MRTASPYWIGPPPALPSLPELRYCGSYASVEAHRIVDHRHDCWELCLVERGSTQWVIDGRVLWVRGGDVVVIPPHLAHQGWQPGRYRYLGLRLPSRVGRGALGLTTREVGLVRAGLRAAAVRPLPAQAEVAAAWERLGQAWSAPGGASAISARASLLQILHAIADAEASRPAPSALVQAAIAAYAETDEHLSIAQLASRLRCSRTHLTRAFLAETGLPPAEYHRRVRIARAWRILATTRRSVTEVAHAFGFPSSQHFATAFRQATGLQPRAARQLANSSASRSFDPSIRGG